MLVLALFAAVFGARAQEELWTVQTVAYPDYRQAVGTAAELRAMGLDAYTEFTMHDGVQYTRVRVGCFLQRHGAEALAELLAGNVTREAVAQPLSEEAGTSFCVSDDVGFVKPDVWEVVVDAPGQIAFRVQLRGHTGFVHMSGTQWRMLPELDTVPSQVGSGGNRFEQLTFGGTQVIRMRFGTENLLVCPGRLIWQDAFVAVVERDRTVSACVVRPSGA